MITKLKTEIFETSDTVNLDKEDQVVECRSEEEVDRRKAAFLLYTRDPFRTSKKSASRASSLYFRAGTTLPSEPGDTIPSIEVSRRHSRSSLFKFAQLILCKSLDSRV